MHIGKILITPIPNSKFVKPTFVSELDQYVNIFSRFAIFSKKNNQNHKNVLEDNRKNIFGLQKNYTIEKNFSLSLRKLDGTPAKFSSNKINMSFVIRPKNYTTKRKNMENIIVRDSFTVLGIQDLNQLTTLKPIYVDIDNS